MGYIWKIGQHPTSPPQNNPIYITLREQDTIRTFRNTIANTSISHIWSKILTFLLAPRRTILPILPRQCLQRRGKYDTNCAVLISHSSSREKDRYHETLWCLYPAGCIVKIFQAFTQQKRTKYVLPREAITLKWPNNNLVPSTFPTRFI